jgi:hypothetical protein
MEMDAAIRREWPHLAAPNHIAAIAKGSPKGANRGLIPVLQSEER